MDTVRTMRGRHNRESIPKLMLRHQRLLHRSRSVLEWLEPTVDELGWQRWTRNLKCIIEILVRGSISVRTIIVEVVGRIIERIIKISKVRNEVIRAGSV